jgi:hypothetical protein
MGAVVESWVIHTAAAAFFDLKRSSAVLVTQDLEKWLSSA